MLQLLALVAVIAMALILFNDCDPASSFVFAISVFVTFIWLTPRLDGVFKRSLWVTVRYLSIYLLILVIIASYVMNYGISHPKNHTICMFKT